MSDDTTTHSLLDSMTIADAARLFAEACEAGGAAPLEDLRAIIAESRERAWRAAWLMGWEAAMASKDAPLTDDQRALLERRRGETPISHEEMVERVAGRVELATIQQQLVEVTEHRDRLVAAADATGRRVHPHYGPCDGFGEEDTCSVCMDVLADAEAWTDKPLPEDAEIDAAFPTRSGRHDLYAEAMRLVGARQSKGGLVELVNWLLHRAERRR